AAGASVTSTSLSDTGGTMQARSCHPCPSNSCPTARRAVASAVAVSAFLAVSTAGRAQDQRSAYLADRGSGIATSMFGTYVRAGETLVYPFYEYITQSLEYKPSELGYGLDRD